jgi:hypothetical protein
MNITMPSKKTKEKNVEDLECGMSVEMAKEIAHKIRDGDQKRWKYNMILMVDKEEEEDETPVPPGMIRINKGFLMLMSDDLTILPFDSMMEAYPVIGNRLYDLYPKNFEAKEDLEYFALMNVSSSDFNAPDIQFKRGCGITFFERE